MFDADVAMLASRQYGLFSRTQVFDLGGNDRLIHTRLGRRWTDEGEGVYGLLGWPDSWWRAVWRTHLQAGLHTVASHETAAALHRLTNFPVGRIVLSTRHGDHHKPHIGEVRQSTDLVPCHIVRVRGLPVTSVVRTLFDLAAVTGRDRLAAAVEDAHITGQCPLDELQQFFNDLRRPGKRGMRTLGTVLAARGPGYVPPERWLERRLLKILHDGGLPEPRLQVQLPWRTDLPSRCDCLFDVQRVLLEADGRRWHVRADQMAEDRRRDREALNHGYRPYRFVYEELRYDPDLVVATVRDALAA